MTTNFKTRFKKGWKWLGLLFILMFFFRLLYGYLAVDAEANGQLMLGSFSNDFFSNVDNIRKNYASEKLAYKQDYTPAQQHASSMAVSQKFEKTASLRMVSHEFENDEKKLKDQVKSFEAVIQYEQNVGLKGDRELHLIIGVSPLAFDSFYVEIQKIGTVKAMEIAKVDKTNEYRQLNARKISIEKTLVSLNELKSKGGQIADFVALSERILEVEERLQELGVELGNFDELNEFCTVKLSMYEGASIKSISLVHRLKVAFEWTVKYFLLLNLAMLFAAVSIFVLLSLVDKLKLMNRINNKLNG